MLNIITPNNEKFPLLELPSQICNLPLKNEDLEKMLQMKALLETLGDTAIGLAAVQVGWPKALFMLRVPQSGEIITCVNPTIMRQSQELGRKQEACLSLPDFHVRIRRPKSVTIKYCTPYGDVEEKMFTGIMSRAIMHELDHLSGRLISHYIDQDLKNINNKQQNKTREQYNKISARRKKNKMCKLSRRRNR